MEAFRAPRSNLLVCLGLVAVFATTVISQYKPYLFLHGDGAFYATTNRALLDGALDQRHHQPASWYVQDLGWNRDMDASWSDVALGRRGEFYPKHPLPLPVLATPLFFLFGYDGLLAFNVLALVTALWMAWRIAARYVNPHVAALTVLAFSAAPLFLRGAYSYSNDVLYAALVLCAIDRFLGGRFGWSGFLFGLALWCKATNVVLALPFGAALVWRRQWRSAAWMAGMALVPVAVWMGLNTYMFGGPFITSYNRILVRVAGRSVPADITARFNRPLREGLHSLLYDTEQGLLPTVSVLLLGVAGLVPLRRRAPLLTATLVISLPAFLWLHARYTYTYARFFTPWAALLLVPMACLIERLAAVALSVAGRVPDWVRRAGRRRVLGAVVVVAVAVVALVRWSHRDPNRWTATYHVEQARVLRGDGPDALQCDYFNQLDLRWECSQHEAEPWQHWGRASGDSLCLFPGASRDWLWLHPNPQTAKSITFEHVPPGVLIARYGLSETSHFTGLRFQLRGGGGRPPRDLELPDIGVIHEVVIEPAEHAGRITVVVPEQPHDWRQLCVQLIVPGPGRR